MLEPENDEYRDGCHFPIWNAFRGGPAERVSEGLPKTSLRNTARRLFDSPAEVNELMHPIVPEATYKRRTRLICGAREASVPSAWRE